jgi:hypothetical protein
MHSAERMSEIPEGLRKEPWKDGYIIDADTIGRALNRCIKRKEGTKER